MVIILGIVTKCVFYIYFFNVDCLFYNQFKWFCSHDVHITYGSYGFQDLYQGGQMGPAPNILIGFFFRFLMNRKHTLCHLGASYFCLGFPIETEKINFVKDHPINIPIKFGFNWPNRKIKMWKDYRRCQRQTQSDDNIWLT
jgi:hypothetical protein